jgi:hypothetical protein
MDLKVLGAIRDVQEIAKGRGIKILSFLKKKYGGRNWRKMKGIALIEDQYGWIGDAEIHWFEAHGVGRVLWKVKQRIDR